MHNDRSSSPKLDLKSTSLSRRGLLGGALGSIVLLACGSDDSDPAPTATTAGNASASATATTTTEKLRLLPGKPSELGAPAVPAAAVSTAANARPYLETTAIYDTFGTTAAPGAFPRTVKHAMGETKLEKAPQRIIPLSNSELDSAVALGFKPVGYVESGTATRPKYLLDALTEGESVGTSAEKNIEKIAQLTPDLILSNKNDDEKIYDLLAPIAPTIFGNWTGVVWKQNFALYSQALGKEREAAKIVADYETRVKKLNSLLPNPRPTISVIRVTANNLRYMQRANLIGTILDDLGFPRPASQNVDDFGLTNMSLETLQEHGDADLIAVAIDNEESNEFGKEMLQSPLWQSLSGVQKGNVMMVRSATWISGIGYAGAHTIMDDIAAHFNIQG